MISKCDVILCCLVSSLLVISVEAAKIIAPPEDYQSNPEREQWKEDQQFTDDLTTETYDIQDDTLETHDIQDDTTETQDENYPTISPIERERNLGEKIPTQRCGFPDAKANSHHNVTQPWVPAGTVAVYNCDPGYYLLGDDRRVCQPNYRWSKEAPPCGVKISVGKSVSCTATENVQSDTLTFLVDDLEYTCSAIQPNRNSNNQNQIWNWKMDLFEEYASITSFRLLFRRKPDNLTITKILVESSYGASHDILPSECSIIQREVGRDNLHEIIITPNRAQPGRYVNFFFKPKKFNKVIDFCEIEVFDTNTASIYQCFELSKLEDTRRYLKNTVLKGKYCYTFIDQHYSWTSASRECSRINDGVLVNDVNPSLINFLLSFSKIKNYNSFFWTGGKAESKYEPDQSQRNSMVWAWNNGKRIDQALNVNNPNDENDCLGIDVSSKLWVTNKCSYSANIICQTVIKQCSSPHLESNVIAVTPYTSEIGSVLSLQCPEGIHRVGEERRECLANGQWSGQSPQCLGEADHAAYQAHQSKLPDEAILGIIIAAVIVGLILIAVIAAIIVSKRKGGRFKKKIYFQKENKKDGTESVETLDDIKEDTSLKLDKDKKENYESVNQSCADETQQETQELQETQEQQKSS